MKIPIDSKIRETIRQKAFDIEKELRNFTYKISISINEKTNKSKILNILISKGYIVKDISNKIWKIYKLRDDVIQEKRDFVIRDELFSF